MYKYDVFIIFLLYSCSKNHGVVYDSNFYKVKYEELFLTQCFMTFGQEKQICEFVPKTTEEIFSKLDYENINRTMHSLLSTINLHLIANSKECRNFYLYTENDSSILDSILLKSIPNANIGCINKINSKTKSYLVYWMKSRNLDNNSKIICELALEFVCDNSEQKASFYKENKVTEMIAIFSWGTQFINGFKECCGERNFEDCSEMYFNWFLEDIDGGREYSIQPEKSINQALKNRLDIVSQECIRIIRSDDFQKMAEEYSKIRIKEQKLKMKLTK